MSKKLGYLALMVLFASFVFTGTTEAKQTVSSKPSQPKYQLKVVKTATPSYGFGDLDIKITESDVEKKETKETRDGFVEVFSRAKISVEKNGLVIDKLSFDHMEGFGGEFGLYLPKPQPLSNYFLIVKHGDYDDHLLRIDKRGKITNIDGGSYFITADKHYIFSNHNEDSYGTGFVVFDLLNNQIVFKTSKGKKDPTCLDIYQWYKDDVGYFFNGSLPCNNPPYPEYQENPKPNWIFAYYFSSNKLLHEPAKDRLKKAKKIQLNFVDDYRLSVLQGDCYRYHP